MFCPVLDNRRFFSTTSGFHWQQKEFPGVLRGQSARTANLNSTALAFATSVLPEHVVFGPPTTGQAAPDQVRIRSSFATIFIIARELMSTFELKESKETKREKGTRITADDDIVVTLARMLTA